MFDLIRGVIKVRVISRYLNLSMEVGKSIWPMTSAKMTPKNVLYYEKYVNYANQSSFQDSFYCST